jgi:hypothetical protein
VNAAHRDGWRTYEFTVAGDIGPVLRSAFAGLEFESVEAGTTLGLGDEYGRDLVDVVARLSAARLTIQEVCVVPPATPEDTSPATGEVPSSRASSAWEGGDTPG